jgi:hypothetical protein
MNFVRTEVAPADRIPCLHGLRAIAIGLVLFSAVDAIPAVAASMP